MDKETEIYSTDDFAEALKTDIESEMAPEATQGAADAEDVQNTDPSDESQADDEASQGADIEQEDAAVEVAEGDPEESEDDPYEALLDVEDAEPEAKPVESEPDPRIERLQQQNADLQRMLQEANGLKAPDMALLDPDGENYDPDEYNRQVFKYQKDKDALDAAQGERQQQVQQQQVQFVQERDRKLKSERPHLFDKDRGPQIVKMIQEAAIASGVPAETVPLLSAEAVSLIDDALRYRAGQKSLKKAKTAKKDSKPVGQTARKGPNRSQEAIARLNKEKSADAFANYLLADME